MSDETDKSGPEAIPAFKISDKRVDDSWKEEVRREREPAAKAAKPAAVPAPASAPVPAAGPTQAPDTDAAPSAPAAAEGAPKLSPQEQMHSKLFLSFVAGLAQQTLVQIGAVENPYSGQREVDLNGARQSIEMLAMLQGKTKGNLTAEEAAMLSETVRELKTYYLQMAQELQREAAAQAAGGAMRPGPGGTLPRR